MVCRRTAVARGRGAARVEDGNVQLSAQHVGDNDVRGSGDASSARRDDQGRELEYHAERLRHPGPDHAGRVHVRRCRDGSQISHERCQHAQVQRPARRDRRKAGGQSASRSAAVFIRHPTLRRKRAPSIRHRPPSRISLAGPTPARATSAADVSCDACAFAQRVLPLEVRPLFPTVRFMSG